MEKETGLKSSLVISRPYNQRPKTVRWKPDESLKKVHYFPMDENERGTFQHHKLIPSLRIVCKLYIVILKPVKIVNCKRCNHCLQVISLTLCGAAGSLAPPPSV